MRLLSCLLAVHLTVYVRWSPSSEQEILRPDVSLMCQTSLRPEAVCGKWESGKAGSTVCFTYPLFKYCLLISHSYV